ncbi:uncharacterized protein METZ01_LOCUS395206 [marine metagenome]|uniref:Uncharacterized protein n=1 Tax=marine metagenome TaxID=408172 RepID=A0A382V778_9ZZZZ
MGELYATCTHYSADSSFFYHVYSANMFTCFKAEHYLSKVQPEPLRSSL